MITKRPDGFWLQVFERAVFLIEKSKLSKTSLCLDGDTAYMIALGQIEIEIGQPSLEVKP